MSENEAEIILKQWEKWDQKQAKRDFIERMERKLFRKERTFHSRVH